MSALHEDGHRRLRRQLDTERPADRLCAVKRRRGNGAKLGPMHFVDPEHAQAPFVVLPERSPAGAIP